MVHFILFVCMFPWQLHWVAAQGGACRMESVVQCRRDAWGFELTVVPEDRLSEWPILQRIARSVATVRADQALLVLRIRWINRTRHELIVDPTAFWLWIHEERPIGPLQWEDLMGILDAPDLPQTEDGRWLQTHTMVAPVYLPARSYTDRFVLFRLPTEGWTRCMLQIDPIWVGQEDRRFRLFCKKR